VSIQGTLGPLVQGSSTGWKTRLKITSAFAAAFLAGSAAAFAVVSIAGAAFGAASLPPTWRMGLAAAGLLSLATVDIAAITKARYCPIGWRRQTPRVLIRRHAIGVVASVWGFDTGLVVTTFRVAAVSWGALLLAALAVSPRWAGLGYGLGFTIPFLAMIVRPRLGRCSAQTAPADPGFEAMLRARAAIQSVSAALLVASSAVLIGTLIA
jgi:hypothetical protein